MTLTFLILFAVGAMALWLGLRIAEEVYQIALMSTGAIAMVWGFFISPEELQWVLEALSLGGLVRLRPRR